MNADVVKKESGLTICARCVHYLPSTSEDRCGAAELMRDTGINLVTGDETWINGDDGTYCDSPHPICSDVNDGNCPYYEV